MKENTMSFDDYISRLSKPISSLPDAIMIASQFGRMDICSFPFVDLEKVQSLLAGHLERLVATRAVGAKTEFVSFKTRRGTCTRWFDQEGRLWAAGPRGSKRSLEAYVLTFGPVIMGPDVVAFAENSEPFGKENLSIKKHAILEVLLDVARNASLSEARAGLQAPISPEQLKQKVEQLRSRKVSAKAERQ